MELEGTETGNVHEEEGQPTATQQSMNDQISMENNKNNNKDVDTNEMDSHKGNCQKYCNQDVQAMTIDLPHQQVPQPGDFSTEALERL
ncbi:hypothetical protein MKX01_002015 [Papaver californicum]|nr:hypothetical protein MKX01_002015 [Papaver californicum]